MARDVAQASVEREPIAIVGMGGVFPGALQLGTFWENLAAGKELAAPVSEARWGVAPSAVVSDALVPDQARSLRACLVDEDVSLSTSLGLSPALLGSLDPLYKMVLSAGEQALQGLSWREGVEARTGVILAAIALPTEGASQLSEEVLGSAFASRVLGELQGKKPGAQEALGARVMGLPAALLAACFGFGGGSYTLDAACASSLYSIKLACDALWSGRAEMMLAGGVSRPDNLYTQIGFSQLRALSPSGHCAPFDARADGLVVGEGAGVLVLKRLTDALRDRDRILATIRGVGLSNDIGGGLLAPVCEGQLRAMRAAYAMAGWRPSDVDIIECHGTGTPLGDLRELESLCTLWQDEDAEAGTCAIGSVKSQIGHLLTAASVAGVIKLLLGMQHETLPPSINYARPAPKSPLPGSPFRVQTTAMPWSKRDADTPRRAAVSAFGFGGINAHLLLEAWDAEGGEKDERNETKEASSVALPAAFVSSKEPVAVVGMGCRLGSAQGIEAFEAAVFGGQSLLRERTTRRWHGAEDWLESLGVALPSLGAFVDDLELEVGRFRLPPQEIEELLPQQLVMLEVAAEALEDAAMPLRERREKMGAFLGVGFDFETTNFHLRWRLPSMVRAWAERSGVVLEEAALEAWLTDLRACLGPALNATRTVGALGGIVGSRVAKEFGLGGSSFVVSGEEASGLRALELGIRALQQHELDAALVGAVDLAGDLRQVLSMDAMVGLAEDGESSAFDVDADGLGVGEGAVSFVLKRLVDAQRDGDRIYAVIQGLGSASSVPDAAQAPREEAQEAETRASETREGSSEGVDAWLCAGALPTQEAYLLAMERAYTDAEVAPSSISLLEAHGCGRSTWDRREEASLRAFFATAQSDETPCALGTTQPIVGHTGAVTGLASLLKASLCLYRSLLAPCRGFVRGREVWQGTAFHMPHAAQYWFRNRDDGPRRAGVTSMTMEGGCMHVVLQEPPALDASDVSDDSGASELSVLASRAGCDWYQPGALFVVEGESVQALMEGLVTLQGWFKRQGGRLQDLARDWWRAQPGHEGAHALAFVAQSRAVALRQVEGALRHLRERPHMRLQGQQATYYNPEPLGAQGRLAFVYPGSGNHYVGMGRGLGARWPGVWERMHGRTASLQRQMLPSLYMPWRRDWSPGWEGEAAKQLASDAHHMIFGQVVHGGFVTSVMQQFGLQPDAVIGYSLGESAGLFAVGAWPAREEMRLRLETSPLFRTQLAGPCTVAREVWGIAPEAPFAWRTVLVRRPADAVRALLRDDLLARLLIVNTPDECVLGGRQEDVDALVEALGCDAFGLEGIVTVHCEVLKPVEQAYFDLHVFPTTAPEGVDVYSGYYGRAYPLTSEAAADSITQQALHGFDYTRTIERAYEDGVRIFVEMGPQGSCSRMIGRILQGRPHMAQSACVRGEDDVLSVMKLLAALSAERVPLQLDALYGARAEPQKTAALAQRTDQKKRPGIKVLVGGPRPTPPAGIASLFSQKTSRGPLRTRDKSSLTEALPPAARLPAERGPGLDPLGAGSVCRTTQTPVDSGFSYGKDPRKGQAISVGLRPSPPQLLPLVDANSWSTQGHGLAMVDARGVQQPQATGAFPGLDTARNTEVMMGAGERGAFLQAEEAAGFGQQAVSGASPEAGHGFAPHGMLPQGPQDGQVALVQQHLGAVRQMGQTLAQLSYENSVAHEAYLRLAQQGWQDLAHHFAWQNTLFSAMANTTAPTPQSGGPYESAHPGVLPEAIKPSASGLNSERATHTYSAAPPRKRASARLSTDGGLGAQAPAGPGQRPAVGGRGLVGSTAKVAFGREACMEFAVGSLGRVLGEEFGVVDSYPVRVRLPDEPLMLVDRILEVEGEKGSLGPGRVVTEHDVLPDAWYLDGGRTPVCIAVEAGQADLFLCSYLGIDLAVQGKRAYRLLDAQIVFHRELPRPGECIRYDIRINRFVRQGEVYLFFFEFDGTVNGEPLLTMRNGCAGFFTEREVRESGGIILKPEDRQPAQGKLCGWEPLVPMGAESYDEQQVLALRQGRPEACFGSGFAGLGLRQPVHLPSGRMELFHRVLALEPTGGRFGLGRIHAEADIHPDDWFLTCHFVDDMVMPGTLMHECCSHTLRVLLMRMGWLGEHDEVCYNPVVGIHSELSCRGPVTPETKRVSYEVELKEIGYNPAPYVVADAVLYADDRAVVTFLDMSMQMTGMTRQKLEALWAGRTARRGDSLVWQGVPGTSGAAAGTATARSGMRQAPKPPSASSGQVARVGQDGAPLYDAASILAFAVGKPSEAFGEPYRVFDEERVIARLPGPPYLFMDRVLSVEPEPWVLAAGGWIVSEYDVPADAWYFGANRQPSMPFAVLLEIALQPCGWLAAYVGSALHSDKRLCFRNLGGEAVLHETIRPDVGTLQVRVRMSDVSHAGGMIIERFMMEVWGKGRCLYEGTTYFGFFSEAALAQQVGILDAKERLYTPEAQEQGKGAQRLEPLAPKTPDEPFAMDALAAMPAGLPGKALCMIDEVEVCVLEGGPEGLGFVRGVKHTDPQEWFFRAHFYQDPVCPGSLGLESFLQLLKVYMLERWEDYADTHEFTPILLGESHGWEYRGQILPRPSRVEVDAMITGLGEGDAPWVKARGFLKVDGLLIYEMKDFGLRLVPKETQEADG